jgi:SH3-like domain-containing protein
MQATMRAALLVAAALLPLHASAGEYRSVGEAGAVLYDAPSREATPLYVVTADYPLEVIVQTEHWVKVRDHMGALTWIEKQNLGERHTVVVTASSAEAHLRPEDGAPIAFVAAQDVALELVGQAPGGWLRVRHADGADGYLRASLVWGG